MAKKLTGKQLAAMAIPMAATSVKDRLNVVFNASHEHFGDQPFGINLIFSKFLESNEQVYTRRVEATEEWQPIDMGWMEDVGASMVVIENLEGKGLVVNPTKKQQEDINSRVLEVSYNQNSKESDEVPPTGFCVRFPSSPLYIRCRGGTAWYRVTCIPK